MSYGWDWGMHPMWGLWGVGMMVMMLVFWTVVIVGMVLGIRWLVSQGRTGRRATPRSTSSASATR